MNYHYETLVDKSYRPFYIYNKKGSVPAGIDIKYRNKTLSTIYAMQLIHSIWKKDKFPKDIIIHKPKEWYLDNTFNKHLFYTLIKSLEQKKSH